MTKSNTVPVVPFSRLRTLGPAAGTAALSAALAVALSDFGAYDGKYSSGLGLVVLVSASALLFFLFLPITLVDCCLLWKKGCAAYLSNDRLGIYRASPWMPWKRGFVEVPLKSLGSIEVLGRSARWGDIIRLDIGGPADLTVETFYMRGRTEDVVEALRAAASQPVA